jgi:hypothetical protein
MLRTFGIPVESTVVTKRRVSAPVSYVPSPEGNGYDDRICGQDDLPPPPPVLGRLAVVRARRVHSDVSEWA